MAGCSSGCWFPGAPLVQLVVAKVRRPGMQLLSRGVEQLLCVGLRLMPEDLCE